MLVNLFPQSHPPMDEHYQPQALETEIQRLWEEAGVFRAKEDPSHDKYY